MVVINELVGETSSNYNYDRSNYYLFDYVSKFSDIFFIINKLIAEGNIKTAKITLIMQILYAKSYRGEITEEEADSYVDKLLQMSVFKLKVIYAQEMKKIGVGPSMRLVTGQSYLERLLKAKKIHE